MEGGKERRTSLGPCLINLCSCCIHRYEEVNVTNFSSSWNDGMAFCAIIDRHRCGAHLSYSLLHAVVIFKQLIFVAMVA